MNSPVTTTTIQDNNNNNNNNNNKQIDITWADIEKEDKELANELKIMCVEYGYDLDHTKIPQNEETKQFTA